MSENETHWFSFDDLVRWDGLGLFVHLVSDALWGWATVRHVVFDSKIIVGSTRVMASSQKNTAICFVLSDNIGSSRSREDSVLSNDEFCYAICWTDLQDRLHCFWRKVTTVSTDDKSLADGLDGIKDGLNEVFGVMLTKYINQDDKTRSSGQYSPPVGRPWPYINVNFRNQQD